MTKKVFQLSFLGGTVLALIIGALFLAQYVTTSETAQIIIAEAGYLGVLIVAIIGGLNTIAPVPPAAFVPSFLAAGLVMPLIIAMLVIGTTIADFIGYGIGRWSKDLIKEHYPKTFTYIQNHRFDNRALLWGFVFIYAAAVPFPNEAFLIPMALVGIKLRRFVIPMILGTTVYHTATAFGAETLFRLLF